MFQDFQAETLKDCGTGQLYGLEKFWAFVKYYKHANELHVEPQLKAKLEPFNTIEDFKVLYTVSEIDCKPVVDNPIEMKVKLDHNFNETLIQIYNMKRKMYCSAPNFRKPTKKLCLIRPGGLGQF